MSRLYIPLGLKSGLKEWENFKESIYYKKYPKPLPH